MEHSEPRRSPFVHAPWLALLLLLLLVGCGDDFTFHDGGGRKSRPLAAVYDLVVAYPDLEFPILAKKGLRLELEITVDPIPPGSRDLAGTILVREARVSGISESFDPSTPLAVTGQLHGDAFNLYPFGPVTVGGQALFIELIGMVSPDGRTLDGLARLSNIADEGTWLGVKQRRYLVAGSDFGLQGTVSVVTVRFGGTPSVVFEVRRDAELVSGDPVAASSGGLPLVVNRLFFDNVQVLDRQAGYLTALQFSTGNGSNPHDALEIAGKIYVTRYEPPFDDVLVADPNTGGTLATIPLGSLATNGSGTARPDRLARAGGLLLVTMQNIDSTFQDYGPGLAAFVDPNDDTVVASLVLAGQNPFGPPSVHPSTGEIYLADAGIFPGLLPRSLSGGVEVLDPVSLTSKGLLVDDDDAGGNVSGVAVTSDTVGYMVVVSAAGTNSLVAFDPATGALGATVLSTAVFIPEIRYDGDGYLLVAEHDTSSPALRVMNPALGTTVVRIPLSLPPVSVAILTRDLAGN